MTEVERNGRCANLIRSAQALLDRWSVQLLDPDFDPWSTGTPAHAGDPFSQPELRDASTEQQLFKATLDQALDTLQGDSRRPLPIVEIHSASACPKNPLFLSLMYYLAVWNHPLDIDIKKSEAGGYVQSLIAV